jgi:tricorn protease
MKHYCLFVLASLLLLSTNKSWAIDGTDTRLLWQPAISKDRIAFIYAEDLWVATGMVLIPAELLRVKDQNQTRCFLLTEPMIAFIGQYDGNTDVFIVPATGGIPKRLTWHPGGDLVRDFSPDGKKILFASQRNSFTNRYVQLFTVDVATGAEEQLQIPNAFWASYSPDGNSIAYTTIPDRFEQWKNYRGGTASRIWLYDIKSHKVVEIPKPSGGSNDSKPVWKGNKVYFRSDRNGEFNLYSYDPSTKAVSQLSKFDDFPVSSLEGSNGDIIFSQAGYLHIYNIQDNKLSRLKIGITADLLDYRPRFVKGDQYIRSAHFFSFRCKGSF